jgi:undecaprenyl-diphosphatase
MSAILDFFKGIDKDVLLYINGHNSPFMDRVMDAISGRFTWIPLYILLAIMIIRDYRKGAILIIIFAVIAIVLSDQASNLIKDHFMRLRPSHTPGLMGQLHYVKDSNGDPYMGGMYGFVSNHAANAASLAIYIILLSRRRFVTIGMIVWVILLCYSRVYLGVHYPSDVICGVLLGIFIGSFAHKACMILQRATSMRDN